MDIQAFKSRCPMGKTGKVSLRVLMINCVNARKPCKIKKKDNWESCKLESNMRTNDFVVIKGNVN